MTIVKEVALAVVGAVDDQGSRLDAVGVVAEAAVAAVVGVVDEQDVVAAEAAVVPKEGGAGLAAASSAVAHTI